MAEIQGLKLFLGLLRRKLTYEIPPLAGDVMMEETKENFKKQEYGNDYAHEKWIDRRHESHLRYPKLDYKGRLKKSFSWRMVRSGKRTVTISFGSSSSYAQLHNEGYKAGMKITGRPTRKPPYSNKKLKLSTKPMQRQFMGVGKRTERRIKRKITRMLDLIFG